MEIILCCFIFLIITIIILIKYINHYKEKIINLKQISKKIEKENNELLRKKENLEFANKDFISANNNLRKAIDEKVEELSKINKQLNNMENNVKQSFEKYCEALDELYNNKDIETEECIKILDRAYEKKQNELELSYVETKSKLNAEVASIQDGLDKLAQTRAAAIEAQRKEKEIKNNKSFYCVQVSDLELSDIKVLSKVRNQLNQPRILNMLIWQTYFSKPMTQLCNNVLGSSIVCGIYKITNTLDDMCYIGQSVNVRR